MKILVESLISEWHKVLEFAPRILIALVVLLLLILVGRALGRVLGTVLERGSLSATHRNFFRRLVVWIVAFLGLVVALNILGLERLGSSLLAGGGVTAIVLGFAFRGIGENFLAGLFLAFSRPFEVGDLIRSAEFEGKVRSIELRYTHIRTEDGQDIFIPSAQIFNGVLVNLTKDGLRRLSFKVGIDYADDPAKARDLLLEATRKVDGVLSDPGPVAMVADLASQYVELQVVFWIDMFTKRSNPIPVRTLVLEGCRSTLLQNGYTVSSEVTSNVALEGRKAISIALRQSQSEEVAD